MPDPLKALGRDLEPRVTKRLRSVDIIKAAVNDGKPLPLQVMLEAMWNFRDRAEQARDNGNDVEAIAMEGKMLVAAATAAPYCHPKLGAIDANQGLGPDEGRALSAHALFEAFRGKTAVEANRIYLEAVNGRLPEVAPAPEVVYGGDEIAVEQPR